MFDVGPTDSNKKLPGGKVTQKQHYPITTRLSVINSKKNSKKKKLVIITGDFQTSMSSCYLQISHSSC